MVPAAIDELSHATVRSPGERLAAPRQRFREPGWSGLHPLTAAASGETVVDSNSDCIIDAVAFDRCNDGSSDIVANNLEQNGVLTSRRRAIRAVPRADEHDDGVHKVCPSGHRPTATPTVTPTARTPTRPTRPAPELQLIVGHGATATRAPGWSCVWRPTGGGDPVGSTAADRRRGGGSGCSIGADRPQVDRRRHFPAARPTLAGPWTVAAISPPGSA